MLVIARNVPKKNKNDPSKSNQSSPGFSKPSRKKARKTPHKPHFFLRHPRDLRNCSISPVKPAGIVFPSTPSSLPPFLALSSLSLSLSLPLPPPFLPSPSSSVRPFFLFFFRVFVVLFSILFLIDIIPFIVVVVLLSILYQLLHHHAL